MPSDGLQLRPTIKDVVFVHIPKAAGTSLREMLVAALPDATKIFDYGTHTATIRGDFVNAFTSGADSPAGVLALRRTFKRDQRLFVAGHFAVTWYLGSFHPASFITFLRHPVDRVISSYKYQARYLNFKGSFADFYEQPSEINVQSKMLWGCDLHQLGFIGLSEALPEMLPALSRYLGVELTNRRDNVSPRYGGPEVDKTVRARILALNDDDLQLYRHVEANLDSYTHYHGRNMGPVLARGRVNHRGEGAFHGWAAAFHTGRLVEIEVRVGAQVVHRCYADQFMPNMMDKNLAPHGVGGFSMRLPAELLAGRPQVRFVFAGTETDLVGSPVAL